MTDLQMSTGRLNPLSPVHGGEGWGEGVVCSDSLVNSASTVDDPPHPNPLPRVRGRGDQKSIRGIGRFALVFLLLLARLSVAASATQPAIVSAKEWGSQPQPIGDDKKQTPSYITLHHAGTVWTIDKDPVKVVRAIQAYGQKEKNWPDLLYHFLIAPDGRIFEGRPLIYQPQSNTNYELSGNIGIELMGNFEVQRPSVEQLRSCVKLSAWLAQTYNIDPSKIRGHKDAAPNQTVCPGKDFYRYLQDGQFVGWVKQTLAGNDPYIVPGPPLKDGPTTQITETQK